MFSHPLTHSPIGHNNQFLDPGTPVRSRSLVTGTHALWPASIAFPGALAGWVRNRAAGTQTAPLTHGCITDSGLTNLIANTCPKNGNSKHDKEFCKSSKCFMKTKIELCSIYFMLFAITSVAKGYNFL